MDEQQKQEQGQQQPLLPPITKEQVLLTGGTLLTTGIIDVATHFNGASVLIGAFAAIIMARHSNDISDVIQHLVPGQNAAQVVDVTERLVDVIAPTHDQDEDQAVLSKLKRLVGVRPQASALPKKATELGNDQPDLEEQQVAGQYGPTNAPEQDAVPVVMHFGPDQRLRLDLSPNFHPDINTILREGIFACGVKGSGKTGVLARIIEQIALVSAQLDPDGLGIPFVVFDKEGDLEPLLTLLPNGRVVDREHWYSAEDIITQRLQVVVNLQSWLKADDAGKVMATLVDDLIEYTSKLKQDKRLPCPVFLDEGQYWLPQDTVSYLSKETQRELADAFSILLNIGRKRGLTPFVFTQRIAQIDKSVIALGVQIFMRQVIDNDQRRCMDYIRADIIGDKKNLAALAEGQGIVCLPKGVQLVVQFDERKSKHLSHAPTVDRILTRSGQTVQNQNAAPAPVREQPPRYIREVPTRQEATVSSRHTGARLPQILKTALSSYVPGMTYRDLGAALGYNNVEAREIWLELRRRGLLYNGAEVLESVETEQDGSPQSTRTGQSSPTVRPLYPVPATPPTQMEDLKARPIDPADLAKAFVLWQSGASSVRKLEAAAKEARYGWSNGKIRLLIEEMGNRQLITKREAGVV